MPRAALLGAAIVLLLGALFVVRPFVAAPRDYAASVPSPASLRETSTVPLAPGEPVCFDKAAIETHSEEVRFNVSSPGAPAPAIEVRIAGESTYRFKATVPPGTLDTQQVRLPIPAALAPEEVRVCLRNLGDEPIGLYASADRTRSRSQAQVDGETLGQSVWFAFHENVGKTVLERLPSTVERVTVFRAWWVSERVVWLLLALFALGVPAGVVWAYLRGLREDESAEPPAPLDVRRRRSWWQRLVG
ncbi:MAG TPA: hypothetical protein VIL49_15745 [Capillimicrobium sp.]|jgi:hypothetical protein